MVEQIRQRLNIEFLQKFRKLLSDVRESGDGVG